MSKSKKAGLVRKVKSKSKSKSKSENNTKSKDKLQVIGMCMKCKKKMIMLNPSEVTLKNGRKAMKGVCKFI